LKESLGWVICFEPREWVLTQWGMWWAWMSRAGLCQALEAREVLPGERTLDKDFASLGRLEGVQTQWGKRGERLYRVGQR